MNQTAHGARHTVHGQNVSERFPKSATTLLLLLLFCLTMLAPAGCATTKKLYGKIAPGSSGLKKRVLVLPFWDQAGLGEEKLGQLTEKFLSLLNRDGAFVMETGRRSPATADRARAPEFGIVTDPEQARIAYRMGMNVMITAVFSPFETKRIKTGLWPFRKIKDETEIAMYVNAFDVMNGTLLFTHLESVKIRTTLDFWDDDEDTLAEHKKINPELDEKTLAKAFSEIVENQASEVSSALRERPWYGRIISSDAAGVFVNAGSDLGVVPGSVFDVLGPGETITSVTGQTLVVPGSKVGELKVTEVMKDRALAPVPEGASFKPGQVIRFKK